MCFYIHPKYPEPLVAKRDIVCYKHGTVHQQTEGKFVFWPFFMTSFRYRQNVVKKLSCEDQEEWPCITADLQFGNLMVSIGFHSYSNKKNLPKTRGKYGYHAVKCIIPKGARYLYNPDDKEYVSTELMVVERLW